MPSPHATKTDLSATEGAWRSEIGAFRIELKSDIALAVLGLLLAFAGLR